VNARLPNAAAAIVAREKIVGYLLNATHRFGASKARFFARFGFSIDEWQTLAVALLRHGQNNGVVRVQQTGFGPRFEVDGPLEAPDGRRPRIRTVWQFDVGSAAPRLITARPLEPIA
jgi:hypothetical protein